MTNQEALATHEDSLRVSILGDRPMESNSTSSNTLRHHISNLKKILWELYIGKPLSYWILILLSGGAMLIAFPASSLLSRLYYSNGGKSKWIISWVAVAGWPLTVFALIPTYFFCNTFPTRLNLKLTLCYAVVAFLSAADNLLYAYAYAYLPASTASLLASSSLIFSALFGYLLVGNRVNASIINSVVMITAALTIIALDSDSDLYGNVSKTQYTMGFIWDILGSALHGLIFALSELLFVKLLGRISFHVVLEQQVMVSLFAFIFTAIGLVVDRSFQGMEEEARNFKGGKSSYCMVLVWGAITFQLGVLGATAVLFLASTMLAGVLNAVRVPLTSIAAVILLSDPMSGFKILSLVVTFWGFCSYIYGSRPPKKDNPATPMDDAATGL
ncbi:probable purine permease 5 [Chenopodium quinoa]|uniref:probable purine permease 5 n=1 Tax=Chenopodium quinoa TaxID=63459 RepID=UPI000B77A898|nr:probable purine permease 5 [Chenopodium quinoa]XP_021763094.1 probable purine permease 5 [Chenopodium quinoa]XP_021763095.1 probable purine permease 5 [Chenopodium quinoa]XP_021763096.1 probable purine permease 5 [Chenopodium quinoa]